MRHAAVTMIEVLEKRGFHFAPWRNELWGWLRNRGPWGVTGVRDRGSDRVGLLQSDGGGAAVFGAAADRLQLDAQGSEAGQPGVLGRLPGPGLRLDLPRQRGPGHRGRLSLRFFQPLLPQGRQARPLQRAAPSSPLCPSSLPPSRRPANCAAAHGFGCPSFCFFCPPPFFYRLW